MGNPRSKPLLVILLVFLTSLSCTEDKQKGKYPKGFRGIRWGTHVNKLQDMTMIQSRDLLSAYYRKNDSLRIDSAQVSSVAYLFYEKQFSGILIEFRGIENLNKLKEAYASEIGQPYTSDPALHTYKWFWPNQLMIVLQYSPDKDAGTLSYAYLPLLFGRSGKHYKFPRQ